MLLIVDHLGEEGFSGIDENTPVTVLALGLMPALYQSRLQILLERRGASVFPTEEVSDRAMARVRRSYPGFIHDLVRQPIGDGPSVLELLDLGEGSLWWFTDAAEKSPLRTPFLNQLYGLIVLDEVLSTREWHKVRVSLNDQVLAETIKSEIQKRGIPIEICRRRRSTLSVREWAYRVKARSFWLRLVVLRLTLMVQTLANRVLLAALGVTKPAKQAPASVIFSRYPVLYGAPYSNSPCERNLGNLITPLRRRGVLWQLVLLNLWPWQLLRHGRQIQSTFAKEQILPLLIFITLEEYLGVFLGPALLLRLWNYWRLRSSLKADFNNWNVTPLWRAELDRSLTGPELLSNLLLCCGMRRLARAYHPKVVIHPCEFQPMERAIWAGLRGTETRSVAFQHTTVSSNTLMYFFAEGEIQEALRGEDKLATPLPDYYLTTGDWPLEVMRHEGYPVARSEVVGAVRYNDLRVDSGCDHDKATIRRQLELPAEGKIVLVTTSSDRTDSIALLETLASAIAHLPERFTFLFKSHYHCRIESEVQKMFAVLGPEQRRAIEVDVGLHEYLRAADMVVLTNSTTGLEAIALGCPPVVFDNRTIVNISPLGDLREAALFAYTPKGLAEAIQAALDPSVRTRLKAAWPEALSRTFHTLDGQADKRFLAFLVEKGLVSEGHSQPSYSDPSPGLRARSGILSSGKN